MERGAERMGLLFCALVAAASCGPSYREQNLASCLETGHESFCEGGIPSARGPERDAAIRRVSEALLAHCARGVADACVYLGKAHLGLQPMSMNAVPALGVALLARACPAAPPELALSVPDQPVRRPAGDEAQRACEALAQAALLGLGMPRDWSAALRFSRGMLYAGDCRDRFGCSQDEVARMGLRDVIGHLGVRRRREAAAQELASARAELAAGRRDDAAVHLLRMVSLMPMGRFTNSTELIQFEEVTPEVVSLTAELWPELVERELAAGRAFAAAMRARQLFEHLKRPAALAGRYRAAVDAAAPAPGAEPTLQQHFRRAMRAELLGGRRQAPTRNADAYGRAPPPPEVRWLFEVSDPSCAFLAQEFALRQGDMTGPPVTVRLENARCARDERRRTETGPYIWSHFVGGGGAPRGERRLVTHYASTNSGCGPDRRLSCAFTYSELVSDPAPPAAPPRWVTETVTRTVSHRALRFRAQGQLVTAGRAPVPLEFVREFDEVEYTIPTPQSFSAATLGSLLDDALYALRRQLRELGRGLPAGARAPSAVATALQAEAREARAHGDRAREEAAVFALASYGPNGGLLGPYLVRLGFHLGDYERLVSGRTLAASEAYLWDPVVAADEAANIPPTSGAGNTEPR